MGKAIAFNGTIAGGAFLPQSEAYYRHQLSKFEGKEVQMILKPKKRVRTLPQNSYYWWCLEIIIESQGNTPEELHEIFKSMFCPRKFIKYKNKEISMPKSTAELTTVEFMDYFDRVKQEAAELGVILPEPNELHSI